MILPAGLFLGVRLGVRLGVLLGVLAAAAGCTNRDDRIAELSARLVERETRIAALGGQVDSLKRQAAERDEQVRTLQALGERRLENLFAVARIHLGRHTGGYAEPGAAADEGVRVYVEPMDERGDVLKAAGDVAVQVFDLAGEEPVRIGEYAFGVEEIGRHWYGGALTNHYRFDCPWPQGRPPAHAELTVRVVFVDYLTGRTFTEQRAVTVRLDGGK